MFSDHNIICGANHCVRTALLPNVSFVCTIVFEGVTETVFSDAVRISVENFRRAVRAVGVDTVLEGILSVCCVCDDRFFAVLRSELEDGVCVIGLRGRLLADIPQLDFASGLWVEEGYFCDLECQV